MCNVNRWNAMTNRQRFGIFLMTSALVGGFLLPAVAAEFTPAPGTAASAPASAPVAAAPSSASAPTPVAATRAPAHAANATPVAHAKHKIVARIATPVIEPVQPRPHEYEIASTAPIGGQCRFCGYPIIFGIAY
jgi:hypothetical protein